MPLGVRKANHWSNKKAGPILMLTGLLAMHNCIQPASQFLEKGWPKKVDKSQQEKGLMQETNVRVREFHHGACV